MVVEKLQNNFKVLTMVKYRLFLFLYKLAHRCLLYRTVAELILGAGGGGGAKIQD